MGRTAGPCGAYLPRQFNRTTGEAGLTKAGLMYHFPTKDAMMIAVIEHVIARWQAELSAALSMPLAESTLADRVRAFVAFAGEGGVTAVSS